MLKEKKENKNKKGFSLVEVLLSLVVFSFGLLAIASLVTINTKTSINAKNQVIAASLAQEGGELIRNIFENETNPALPFDRLANTPAGGEENDFCRVDSSFDVSTWSVGNLNYCRGDHSMNNNDEYFNLSQVGGFYVHAAGVTATKFTRRVSIRMLDDSMDPNTVAPLLTEVGATKLRVRVMVTWNNRIYDIDNCTVANSCLYVDSILTKK